MQWRRIVFSFVIVFGATLWALPSSALAFDLCVRVSSLADHTCPPHTTYSPTGCGPAGPWATGEYEHTCTSPVDPCDLTIGGCSSSCPSSSFRNSANCEITLCPGQQLCVDKTGFNSAVAAIPGGATACGTGGGGTCQTACSATATPPTEVDSTGATTCSAADPAKPNCCKPTAATCGTPPAPGCTGTPPPDCTADPTLPGCASTTVKNPLNFSTVEEVLTSLLGALQAIIVVLSLIFIVIGAILYITSAGDEDRMKTAKGSITAAVIGLALGIAAPSFLKQIGDILGWGVPAGPAATAKSLSEIALNTLQFLLSVVGVLGIIMLVIGGIIYLTSAGDENRAETGKKTVTYAIIGIAIALASLMAVTQIAKLFV